MEAEHTLAKIGELAERSGIYSNSDVIHPGQPGWSRFHRDRGVRPGLVLDEGAGDVAKKRDFATDHAVQRSPGRRHRASALSHAVFKCLFRASGDEADTLNAFAMAAQEIVNWAARPEWAGKLQSDAALADYIGDGVERAVLGSFRAR